MVPSVSIWTAGRLYDLIKTNKQTHNQAKMLFLLNLSSEGVQTWGSRTATVIHWASVSVQHYFVLSQQLIHSLIRCFLSFKDASTCLDTEMSCTGISQFFWLHSCTVLFQVYFCLKASFKRLRSVT